MTKDDEVLLRRYLSLRAQLSELEEELEKLKPAVFDIVDEEKRTNGEPVVLDGFKFELHYRRTYTHSAAVEALKEQLSALKKQEEQSGIATLKSQTGFVRVVPIVATSSPTEPTEPIHND
ncbi:MAG: hypothetical protein RMI34_09975 [Chloroherpetonaceae bacterium]|nr:hypothetical protein [Chloroherpetonaceae bacterium]MCS7211339.1 hypothetical protein [Chloroherpetonaceae bacterium]MDW8020387.1 hypothetical protein [Chloroherpetonaceae bacterium]MDW8465898.1 hypothetical protein [Chloroherpetonaceae bacterium]